MKQNTIPTMFRLYPKQREAVAKASKEQEISWGAIVRNLIDTYLLKK
jgi:hypothetical protein